MKNGVFFRLALTIPKNAVARWKKAKLDRTCVPGEYEAHKGSSILGGELSVEAKTLKAALETLEETGMAVAKSDVGHWEKIKIDGKPHIRIETKGALKRNATVKDLLAHLKKQASRGDEMTIVHEEKDGRVEVRGYLGGWEAYSDHFLPLLMLGGASLELGGEGELVFQADVELLDEPVFAHAAFTDGKIDLTHHDEPQDITQKQSLQIELGLGEGGAERIQKEHAAWLVEFVQKKRRRDRAGLFGWLRPDGTFAIEPRFPNAGGFSEGLALVAEHGPFDYGYIDEKGTLVIPHRFFSAGGFAGGRARVEVETRREQHSEDSETVWHANGYIDRTGALVIPATWGHAEDFVEERAVVGKGKLRGYIDPNGRVIVEPHYQTAKAFADGLALVAEHSEYDTGGFGFIDRDGKVVVPLELDRAGVFHKGFAPAAKTKNGLWGFLDRSGAWRLEPRFQLAGYLEGDRAIVMEGGMWGVVDGEGRTIIPFAHEQLIALADRFVSQSEGKSTFFSKDGAELFSVRYEVLGEVRDGRLTIAESNEGPFGYMGVDGRVLMEPRFGFAAPFSDGLAIVEDGRAWGIIDHSGKMTKKFDFRLVPSAGASHFAKNGLAYIESCAQFGLVDREGRVIHPPEFEAMNCFGEDLIFVKYPGDLDD